MAELASAPYNDDFAKSRNLSGRRVTTHGTTIGATLEPGEPYVFGNTTWFEWTAPVDGVFRFSLTPADAAQGTVFIGQQLNALSQRSDSASQVVLRAGRGERYQIRVNGWYQHDSRFTLRIRPVNPPPNDDFANAIVLSDTNTVIEGTVLNATHDGNVSIYALGQANVWYRWEALSDGLFLASIDSDFEAIQSPVYQGTNILHRVGQAISGLKHGTAFYATNGGIYWISADGYSTFASNFTLTVSAETPPPNDHFTNSTVVAGAEVSVVGSSLGATFVAGEPGHVFPGPSPPNPTPGPATPPIPAPGPAMPTPSPSFSVPRLGLPGLSPPTGYVWYSWTAPTTGGYRISARLILPPPTGLGARPGLADYIVVLSGNFLPELTQVASGYSGIGAVLRATAGVTYHAAVPGGKTSFHFEIEPLQLPPNDDYTNAIVIAGAFVTESGSTLNATPELSSPYSDSAVWYRWIAPSNGFFAVTVLPGNHRLAIYTGNEFTTAELLHGGDIRPVVRALAGQEFRIGVAQAFSGSNAFVLNIEPVTPPANDDFGNSEVLLGTNINFIAQVRNSTAEANEPGTAWAAARNTVWFSWTAPTDGQFTIRFATNAGRVTVYTGAELLALEYVSASISDSFGSVFFGARAGTIYHFSVDDVYGYASDFSANNMYGYASDLELELRLLPPPLNDNFANRSHLSGANASASGTLVGATMEPGEPDHLGSGTGQSAWWSWTAPRSGRARIEVSRPFLPFPSPSSSFLWVAVYTGSSLPELIHTNAGDRFEFSVEQGETYHLAVLGADTVALAEFQLSVRLFDVPSNDAFADRKRMVKRARGTTNGASREEGEPGYDADPAGASVWWKWRAPRNGVYELILSGGTSRANLYTGEQVDDLTPVVSANEFGRLLRFRAIAGTFYVIELSNANHAGGNYQFKIARRPAPENDDFAERIQLIGTDITVVGNNAFATPEPDEPPHSFDEAQRSVWWRWTPPTNGAAFIQFDANENLVKRAGIYTGERLDELESIGEGNGNFYFDVIGGVEVQMAMDDSYSFYNAPDPWQFHLLLVPAPANDNFAARTPLAGTNVHVTGSFVGASQEDGEPFLFYSAGHSVWWSWAAPETGSYTFRLKATNTDPTLGLYSGPSVDSLEAIAPVEIYSGVSEVNVPLMAGEEIAIRTDGSFELATDQFELTITKASPPPNDAFGNRAELIDGRGVSNNEGATGEIGEWGGERLHLSSVWWHFTAASNGWHTLVARLTNSAGGSHAIQATLLTGDNVTNLSGVPASEWHLDRRYHLIPGTDYSIRISDSAHRFGVVGVEVRHVPSPANDNFANATRLLGEHVSIIGSNTWTLPEWGEPSGYAGSSVWWRWIPERDGVYLLTLNPTYSMQYLDVYTGTSLSNLTLVPHVGYGAPSPASLFRARGGLEHFIRLTSHPFSEAQFTLGLDHVQPPSNDDFTNRIVIAGQHISLTASNSFATPETGDPLVDFLSHQTVWWKWIAPASGRVSLTLTNSPYLRLGVYVGSELTNLVSVLDNPTGNLPKTFNAQAGMEYQIAATTSSYYAAAEFTLVLDLVPSTPSAAAAAAHTRGVVLFTRANQVIETSTDLVRWTPYRTNAPTDTNVTIVPRPDEPQRFFRAR